MYPLVGGVRGLSPSLERVGSIDYSRREYILLSTLLSDTPCWGNEGELTLEEGRVDILHSRREYILFPKGIYTTKY